MLIEFYGENFGCFRDKFCLSLLASDIEPGSSRGVIEVPVDGDDKPLRLLRAAGIYGPNASGKSTVIRAAAALSFLLRASASFPSEMPLLCYEPFRLKKASNGDVTLGVKAVIGTVVYDYSVTFSQEAVQRERLENLSHSIVLFKRQEQDVSGTWADDDQFKLLSRQFRKNALVLALADAVAPDLAKDIASAIRSLLNAHHEPSVFGWPRGWDQPNRLASAAKRAATDSPFATWMLSRLRDADIGVVKLDARPTDKRPRFAEGAEPVSPEEARYRLMLSHQGEDDAYDLRFDRESLGTRRLVELAPLLYDQLHERGRADFVDEFDASMHPTLLTAIVDELNCSAQGQLVFAAHETSLFEGPPDEAALRRDQVYFTSKGPDGASTLYSLAEFNERNVTNPRKRYLEGRYGALPSLGTFRE